MFLNSPEVKHSGVANDMTTLMSSMIDHGCGMVHLLLLPRDWYLGRGPAQVMCSTRYARETTITCKDA